MPADDPKPDTAPSASRFYVGQRVRLTAYGRQLRITQIVRTKGLGTVTGVGGSPLFIRVRPDTYKQATTFHVAFWEPND